MSVPGPVALLATLLFASVGSVAAQERATAAQPDTAACARLRVSLVCPACDHDVNRREIGYVTWVDDDTAADVEVVATRERSREEADEAARYRLVFTGRGRFGGWSDTLTYTPDPAVDEERRQGALARMIELGLVRYAASTSLAAGLRVGFTPLDTAPRVGPPTSAGTQPAQPSERWDVGLDLGFTGAMGNSDLIALSTGIRVKHLQTRRFRLEWAAGVRYGESGGEVVARHLQTRLDFDVGPGARLGPFISAAAERDPFRRLELRGNAGFGLKYSFHHQGRDETTLRAGALYSHERFTPEAERPAGSDATWRLELRNSRGFGNTVRFENTSRYDPVVGDTDDFILDVKSKVTTRITPRLALSLTHTYSYDSTPAAEISPSDQRVQAGVTVAF